MGFELITAAKNDRDPAASAEAPLVRSYGIELRGTFDEAAGEAVLRTVPDLLRERSASVVIDITGLDDPVPPLDAFAAEVMRLRADGWHVQVAARDPRLHAALAAIPDARDWLVARTGDGASGPRIALHLDQPRPAAAAATDDTRP